MKFLSRLCIVALMAVAPLYASAADAPADPARQTPWGLYLTAPEAAAMKEERGDAVLFVDVRDPVEIMFTGFADAVDVNVPFLLSNTAAWNDAKSVFAMEPNPDFATAIEAALVARGLDKTAPVILMCRSGGERGAPSAKALEPFGFAKVYVVVDGFEGGTSKTEPGNPVRNLDGWKNSGLPWGYKLDRDKIWFRK
ncbi:MAG: sulfurtransferase [Alphaproteobacteria bacterium HGW-Alphaproteobacteria-2]|nr:MAG: sulfurtransferase [Alphaproteobacteria bacterium HGW-Alphaproteobacteria-2]